MRLDRFIAKTRIIDIKSGDLNGALTELVQLSLSRMAAAPNVECLVNELLERESTMTTYLGNGVAMPHIRINQKRPYLFARKGK